MKIVQPFTVLDTNLLSSNVPPSEYSLYSSLVVYKTGDRVIVPNSPNAPIVYESLTGKQSTVTITIASPGVVTWNAHGLADGTPISFTTTGTLPTGIVAGTVYYVKTPTTNTFNIASAVGGTAINTTGTQSGVHTATSSINFNKDPSTTPLDGSGNPLWLNVGTTNLWSMFDSKVQSQTTNPDNIAVSILANTYVDTIALLNIDAASVTVVVTHPTAGTLYNKTITTTSYLGVTDWYSYFFNPIDKQIDILFEGIPLYAGITINVTVTKTGSTAKCGACILGYARDISSTKKGVESGAKVSIDDYSIKTQDTFGNYTIVERAFNKRADFTVVIETSLVDGVQNLLAKYRATPILYIGSNKFASTVVYGFYKNFEIDIAYDTISYCTIQLEGLT